MIGSVELITPAKAEAMLARNAANRPITTSLVRRYAAEMRARAMEHQRPGDHLHARGRVAGRPAPPESPD